MSSLDVTPDLLTGFLVPECCLEVWAAETTITSAEPITAQLVADRTTRMRLLASGTPIASDALEIMASAGGVAGGPADFGAGQSRFLMRPTEDPAVDWRGLDPPLALSYFEAIVSGRDAVRSMSVVVTAAGVEIMCWCEVDTGPALRPATIFTTRRERGAVTFEGIVTVYTESVGGVGLSPRIVRTESGRIDIYALTEAVVPQQVMRFSSFDDGETWEQSSTGLIQLEADQLTIQVAAGGGQVLLFANSEDGLTRTQYASSDDGNSFSLLDTAQAGHTLAVTYSAGVFLELVYIELNAENYGSVVCVSYGSAFTAQAPATAGVLVFADETADDVPVVTSSGSIIVDDTGTTYAYWCPTQDGTTTLFPFIRVAYSVDGGLTWEATVRNAFAAGSGATTSPFDHFAVGWSAGTASIVFGATAAVYWGRLGGWTNRTLPSRLAGSVPGIWSQAVWTSTFAAFASYGLDNLGSTWVETNSGATVTKTAGALDLTGTTGDEIEYVHDLTAESDAPAVKIGVGVFDGLLVLSLHATTTEATARTFGFSVHLNYDSGTMTVRDDSDSSILYGPVTMPVGATEYFLAIGRSAFTTYTAYLGVRSLVSAEDERVYAHRLDAEPLGVFGVAETESALSIYCDDSADFDVSIYYVFADLASVDGYGLGRAYGPNELFGAPFSPRPTYVRDGVSIRAMGSCNRNDSWAMTPSTYYAVANALPHVLATPRRGHLSTSTTGAAYAFQLTTGGDAPRGGLWAIYLDGITYASAAIAVRTGGIWSTLGTVSFGERIAFDSVGGTITPAEAPDAAPWYREGDLIGCRVQDSDNTIGKVLANDEGAWSTDGQATRLRLDAATTAGSDRAGTLWHRRAVVYLYLADSVTFEGLRLTVTAYTGGPTIGTDVIAIGRVRVLGDGIDQTRAVATELGEVLTELPDGGAAVTRVRPDRRQVEISHTRGNLLPSDGSEPPHVRALAGGPAVGSGGDPATMEGMIRHVGRAPLVYLPAIPARSGSSTLLGVDLGARGAVYGRFVPESYRIESATGHAEQGEIVRTSVVTILEEV